MMDFSIQNQKLDQVAGLLRRYGLDMWMTLGAETSMKPEPALDFILGLEMTWLSAFILTDKNERIGPELLYLYDGQTERDKEQD